MVHKFRTNPATTRDRYLWFRMSLLKEAILKEKVEISLIITDKPYLIPRL